MAHATSFYKTLFGSSGESSLKLAETFWQGRGGLFEDEKLVLVKPFSEEEVKAAIFEMKYASAPGPNGFGAHFFKNCWTLIKGDYMSLFKDFLMVT